MVCCRTRVLSHPVLPDLAKFRHFGKFLTVYFLFGKMLSLLWQICDIIGLIFGVANGQILKNFLTIWSHLSHQRFISISNRIFRDKIWSMHLIHEIRTCQLHNGVVIEVLHSGWHGVAIAQWIRLRLSSCGPGFESQAYHLTFYIVKFYTIFVLVLRKRTKISKKRLFLAHI